MDNRLIFLSHLANVNTMGRRRRIQESGDGRPDWPLKAGSRRKIRGVINGENGDEVIRPQSL